MRCASESIHFGVVVAPISAGSGSCCGAGVTTCRFVWPPLPPDVDVAARRQRLGLAGAELAACVAACSGVGLCISTPPSGPSSLTTGSIASVHSFSRCGTSRPTVG